MTSISGVVGDFEIETHSEPGDRVLDPFAGSSTTLAVAQHLGRQAVGVELLADRVAMARARTDDPSYVVEGNALDLDRPALGTFELCLTSPSLHECRRPAKLLSLGSSARR